MPVFKKRTPGLSTLFLPDAPRPVVVDSPHSGRVYPEDFDFSCDFEDLRRAEDLLLDDLLLDLPEAGVPLLVAEFPRSYVDVNRSIHDIDDALLDRMWPGVLDRENGRSFAGIGVIRRLLRPGVPVYGRRLSVEEVRARLDRFYLPYHAALDGLLAGVQAQHGAVLYLDLHSMSPRAFGPDGQTIPADAPDIVLGDRDGTTCDPSFVALARELFTARGYRVGYNHPYKGAELLLRHGCPRSGRHALQIEISKALYVDEFTLTLNANYAALKADLADLIALLAGAMESQDLRLAAD